MKNSNPSCSPSLAAPKRSQVARQRAILLEDAAVPFVFRSRLMTMTITSSFSPRRFPRPPTTLSRSEKPV